MSFWYSSHNDVSPFLKEVGGFVGLVSSKANEPGPGM
jgi:hypothetical protein